MFDYDLNDIKKKYEISNQIQVEMKLGSILEYYESWEDFSWQT